VIKRGNFIVSMGMQIRNSEFDKHELLDIPTLGNKKKLYDVNFDASDLHFDN
jgi:hypothetical protein